jgi:hypothetical protein
MIVDVFVDQTQSHELICQIDLPQQQGDNTRGIGAAIEGCKGFLVSMRLKAKLFSLSNVHAR